MMEIERKEREREGGGGEKIIFIKSLHVCAPVTDDR